MKRPSIGTVLLEGLAGIASITGLVIPPTEITSTSERPVDPPAHLVNPSVDPAAGRRLPRRRRRVLVAAALAPVAAATVAGGPSDAATAPLPGATVRSLDATHADASPATTATVRGSIVYLKSNNVWIMRGNGGGRHAVTTDGTAASPYRSPSQSDTGVVVASRGSLIIRMTQHGTVLNTLDPPMLVDSAGEHLDGTPNEVAISPNGRSIAWSYSFYGCPPGLSCGIRLATGYTAADRLSPAAQHATSFYGAPSWIGNGRTLQTGTASTVELQDIDSPSTHWFYDSAYANPPADLTDAELSDDGQQLAITRGFGTAMTILWYSVNGDARTGTPPAAPTPNCISNPSPGVGSPTWAPGGAALAYAYPAGIYVVTSPQTCGSGVAPTLIAPGGTHPDWSKAPLA